MYDFGRNLVQALILEHGTGEIRKTITACAGNKTAVVLSKAGQASYAAKAAGLGAYVGHSDEAKPGEGGIGIRAELSGQKRLAPFGQRSLRLFKTGNI